jgi:membrane-bound lytic murein transglycosylase B
LLTLALGALAQPAAFDSDAFDECVADLEDRARQRGVNERWIARATSSLAPLNRVIELDRSQPEFVQTFATYLSARITEGRVAKGRELLARHAEFLDGLVAQYGVPPRYLIAFWGLETNYGSYLGKVSTLDALATLACDKRRSEFFAEEFVSAVRLMERDKLPPEQLQGSWAGAVGHTQFMPSSYLRYAVDGDGDGQINLWDSERDALVSGANLLRGAGWKPGLKWGRRVQLKPDFPFEMSGLSVVRDLSEWSDLGVTRVDGGPLPALDLPASLLLPAGHLGPAFLVYDNFRVIMRWNQSQSYALSVGLLADRLAGAPALRLPDAISQPLRRQDVESAQRTLDGLGYDVGEADGVIGRRTRTALRAFQQRTGLPADGYLDQATLKALDSTGTP